MYSYPYRYYQWPITMPSNWGYYWDPRYYNWSYNYPGPPYRDIALQDYGTQPFVVNLDEATEQNNNYRTALWTGHYMQLALMSINVGEDIGLEVHPTTDQFLRVEEGQGLVQMGDSKEHLDYQAMAYEDYGIMIPAGKWHNVINTGNKPLKLYSIYAPPQHPFGTVQQTRPAGD
ncbi:cupin domain-containing protein [Paenibacillus glycanilyticus]|uniref:cupin domain-containing protein n=1 Tax=Paenibacillus glycanilyticus TaxID=126569 RepID=UPI0020420F59|nr:cupin domain-containing protein [Paenibacillus glycanilyticus]MCM3627757.1 cupin domain-containing protein [Paenibacillus glycanilyticus]